jgi:hypothetical protein
LARTWTGLRVRFNHKINNILKLKESDRIKKNPSARTLRFIKSQYPWETTSHVTFKHFYAEEAFEHCLEKQYKIK